MTAPSPGARAVTRRFLILIASASLLTGALVSAASAAARPAPPTGLGSTTTSTTAVLTWSKAKNATKYRACLQETKGQTPCAQLGAKTVARTWTFNGLQPGRHYLFTVFSYNSSGRAVSAPHLIAMKNPPAPSVPTGITQVIGQSSIKVSWAPASHAKLYAVCLMTSSATETCSRSSAKSSALTTTFTNLTPTSGADYFYRVYAYDDDVSSRSDKHRVDLPVAALSGIDVPKVRAGAFRVTWTAATNAETYTIQIATSSDMTAGLTSHSVAAGTLQYSPTNLTPGIRYYVRVRGENGVVLGQFSAVQAVPLPTLPFSTAVMTYNLCGQDHCRNDASSRARIEPWKTRKPLAGAIVRASGADLIATQESQDEDTAFISELPGFGTGAYKSAKTIFYRKSVFRIVHSGEITLDAKRGRYAVWDEFEHKATHTTFFFVDPHLEPYKNTTTTNRDKLREAQTNVLIAAIAKQNTSHRPVIYAGDFNSNKSNASYPHGYDGPLKAFTAAGVPDGISIASSLVHELYNSANQATNPPLIHGDHVDHIFVTPDVAVNMWGVVVNIVSGKYVTPFASDHNPVKASLTVPGLPGLVG